MVPVLKIILICLRGIDSHTQELVTGAGVAIVVKVLAAGCTFGLNVVLAKLLGASGSGIFYLALTVVVIVAAMGRIGMENALVKFIAANVVAKNTGKVLGVYRKAILYSLCVSLILSILLCFTAPWLSQVILKKPDLTQPLTIMAFAVMPLSLLTLHANALQGLKKIAASISVLTAFVPLLTCFSALLFCSVYGINAVAIGFIVATLITLLLGRIVWVKATAKFSSHTATFDRKQLLACSMPLYGVVMLHLIILWSPLLFLGVWESSESVGIYAAASRTASLTSFGLAAVNSISAPKFAALYQQADMNSLGRVARNSVKITLLFAFPLLLLFVMAPGWVLSIFGEKFTQGAAVLIILAVGQFVNVTTGSVGVLLMMSGNERLMRNNLLFSAIVGILLNLWLIPCFGVIGGAVAAAIVLAMQNLIAFMLVRRNLNITLFWAQDD